MNTVTPLRRTLSPGQNNDAALAARLIERYEAARNQRTQWTRLWEESYEYALPQRGGFLGQPVPGAARNTHIYDATAMDAADQLASSLLANLTPAWSQWFGLKPGPDLSPEEAVALTPVLEKAARTIQSHFDRSNFPVEIHQCYLDLVVGGTATISFEEAEPGGFSAFRFSCIPLSQIVLEEGANGALDGAYRHIPLTLDQIFDRYPFAEIPAALLESASRDPQVRFKILESVLPAGLSYEYMALLDESGHEPVILQSGTFEQSPVISFRWMKSPGEIYGRSPVMKALPDIKTANKVVELILKNASIAVTGIWQADDDGVLNPANIELTPGSIIPKAVGSKGLQPLDMPGRFDVSQLILENLQSRIRHALLTDKLSPVSSPRMTATEVLERAAEMSLLLGATYGRLQTELLTPLIKRAFAILRRRGEVPDIALDGRLVTVDYRSPLARSQGQRNVQNTLTWITSVLAMGPEAAMTVNLPAAARFLGEALAVPGDIIRAEILAPVEDAQRRAKGGRDV
ncbi:MAG: head-tail connector protein [Alphaproteobacteria bacterium]|nr:head-tail connector protein [Alphaproteobacteria bacterium]MBP7759305.1 head-tail connector protein [Alphaproteobacteria bacterium]MBP7762518.1 head-tail connector protein [Alphaproteobacteria bacterium]MBP7904265.1 head-tail connector protein [Alphaproteobacteria bacterium]